MNPDDKRRIALYGVNDYATDENISVPEIVAMVEPPLTEAEARALILAAKLPQTDVRRPGKRGGPRARTWLLTDFLEAYRAIAPLRERETK